MSADPATCVCEYDMNDPAPLPLVLLTGRMTSSHAWAYQRNHFTPSREVLAPESYFAEESVAAMAARVIADLPDRFDLVGWSMGGYVALQLALTQPGRIGRLVLISTSAQADLPGRSRLRRLEDRQVLKAGLSPEWCREQLAQVANLERAEPDFLSELCIRNARLTPQMLLAQTRACSTRPDLRNKLSRIEMPVLVVGGGDDSLIPPAHQAEIAEHVPRAQLRILDAAAHCAPFELPQQVNALIADFLTRKECV